MTAPSLRPVALALLAVVLGGPASVGVEARVQSARDRYEAAVALERDAREGAERGDDEERAARTARRALVLYESVVRRFPTSGYCDNALMRGGDLARWLFTRSGRAADRTAAAKYYAWLVREYPGSGLRGQARAAVRALEAPGGQSVRQRAATAAPEPARAVPPVSAPKEAVPTAAGAAPRVSASRGAAPTRAGAVPPVFAPAAPPASATPVARPTAPPTLRGIDRADIGSGVRVTLKLDRETTFAHEVLEGPRRAFVDLFGTTPAADLQDAALRYEADAVRQVRVGRRPGATRVVLDLDGASSISVFTLYNPFRVVIDAERPVTVATMARSPFTPAPPVAAPAVLRDDVPATPRDENEVVLVGAVAVVPAAAPMSPPPAVGPIPVPIAVPAAVATEVPAMVPPLAAPPAPAHPAAAAPPPVLASAATSDPGNDVELTAPVPSVPAANVDGSFSLARQLGLGISRVVIDAGHGGHDPGTLTQGTSEARLVLDVALRLERLLSKEPGLEVVLTRRTDVFIPLEQRTAIANREGADLFLSIHANASRDRTARGVETYFLSFASNPEAEAVAARENATSASDMHSLPSIVRAIALNNKLDESRDLAGMVQQSLTSRLSKTNPALRSRGVKKAPFVVLIGAGMPSVLAEIGFLTNRQESSLVKTAAYRQRIAESLHAAVMQYRRALKRQTSVATR